VDPGAPLPDPVAYVLGNALKAGPDAAEIVVERAKKSHAGSGGARDAGGCGGRDWRRARAPDRDDTRIFAVLRAYEAVYHDAVRRRGS